MLSTEIPTLKLYNQNCNNHKNGQMWEKTKFIKILQKTNERYTEEEELSFDNYFLL